MWLVGLGKPIRSHPMLHAQKPPQTMDEGHVDNAKRREAAMFDCNLYG